MKILINTSDDLIEINGTLFIKGEWVHVESDFVVPEEFYDTVDQRDMEGNVTTVSIPRIKPAPVILDEKLALIPDAAPVEVIQTIVEEQNINGWVNGILEAGY